jgi:hypothetical protein
VGFCGCGDEETESVSQLLTLIESVIFVIMSITERENQEHIRISGRAA